MKPSTTICLLLFFTSALYAQPFGKGIDEIQITPTHTYGFVTGEAILNEDSSFNLTVYDESHQQVFVKGKLKSKNPPIKQGQFTFFDPEGNPFASGFYSEDVPYRAWSFFDEAGKVIESINYSSAIKFLNERSNIDIGNNFLYVADSPPHNEQGDIFEWVESLGEYAVYPPFAQVMGEQDILICQFTIDTEGRIINPEIVRGGSIDFNMEVMRLLSLSPKWNPAIHDGKAWNYTVTAPIRFTFGKSIPLLPDQMELVLVEREDSYQQIGPDEVKIYFDRSGSLSNKKEYTFYRLGTIGPDKNIIEGEISDFDSRGKKVFDGIISNGELNGTARLYNEKGQLIVEGHYTDGERDSIWTTYYTNGNVKGRFKFDDRVFVLDYFKKNGKPTVSDGDGFIKWEEDGKFYGFEGEIRSGLRVGTWENSLVIEVYDDSGNFKYQMNTADNIKNETQSFYFFNPILSEFRGTTNIRMK